MSRFTNILKEANTFAVTAELTPGLGYNPQPIVQFLKDYQAPGASNLPDPYRFVGIMVPQSPGGVANLDPSDVLAALEAEDGLLKDLEFIPHITCKDHNQDAILSSLIGYQHRKIKAVLALTGDKPVSAKGVFQNDAVGLLQTIGQLNRQEILGAKPGQWEAVNTFTAGAAVSPFKYTEPSLMQQYFKMEKKIHVGAGFLVTQVGWDWKKSLELMTYLKEAGLDIPVLGNVYLLSTKTPAPRLMRDRKLPGCYVSDELFDTLKNESYEQHLDRAAQQVAMYQALGAAGVDIGGVHDFQSFQTILEKAAEIKQQWEGFKDNLCYTPPQVYYLYDETGKAKKPTSARKTVRQRWFNFMHDALLNPDHTGFHAFKKTMALVGAEKKPDGFAARSFTALERAFKYTAFRCEDCGDCYLPENFGYCTLGGCQKGLPNAPCGDATVEGKCGNDLESVCRGEQIYQAAAAESGGLEKLRTTINQPRNPELAHSASILNYLFGKDHTMGNALISIGEVVHASIPKTGKVMKELQAQGAEGFERDSGALDYMRALIEGQAEEGADYIAINVDAFGEIDPQLAVEQMIHYVKLVRQYGRGVPVCIDSSNDNVLRAGLETWYEDDGTVEPPLINSIKVYTLDNMMPLKKDYDFSFIGLLMSEDKPTGPGGSHSVEELLSLAQQLFDRAVGTHGFKPEEIFFDSTVFPLAIDMPMQPGVPGYTYRAFETIKRIKNDPSMKGVHCSLGISNCCRDLPGRRIGICRAYVAKAMEYGLDAGIVNVNHHYGQKPVDPGLLEMVDAFAQMDGTTERTDKAIMLMSQFCADNKK